MRIGCAEQSSGFGPFRSVLMLVVVVVVEIMASGVCGVVAIVEPPRQVAAGPLGLRSGKKKHNFLFYFP